MDDFLECAQHGYEIQEELGHNRAGGRVTYLAMDTRLKRQVVIKQFQFAKTNSSWRDYEAYNREIQVMRGLHHPGVPRYLNSFQTESGFCMVQEYKNAYSLGVLRSFSLSDIEKIAVALLKILIYLQNRVPSVIHRDVKPENILVDDGLNVYLVDFGFARIGDGDVTGSSVVKGTLGFMPPEQLFNRKLSEASDLYGLGVTLICLLTRTKSGDVGNLIDVTYRVNFKHLVPKLSAAWLSWLEKMVEPRVENRFPNAIAALDGLPDHPMRLPEVQLSHTVLSFRAHRLGEQLKKTITVTNLVPDTELEGIWEVAAHPSDPPHPPEVHPWITVEPASFVGNQAHCQISILSDRLLTNKTYVRNLLLYANTVNQIYTVTIEVHTVPIRLRPQKASLIPLGMLSAFSVSAAWVMSRMAVGTVALALAPATAGLSVAAGVAIGCELAACMVSIAGAATGATAGSIAGLVVGLAAFLAIAFTQTGTVPSSVITTGIGFGLVGGIVMGGAIGIVVERFVLRKVSPEIAILVTLLTAAFGVSGGLGLTLGFLNPWVLVVMAATGIPLALLVIYTLLNRIKLISQQRRGEEHLIRP
jgi:serine/threonine protein kinase